MSLFDTHVHVVSMSTEYPVAVAPDRLPPWAAAKNDAGALLDAMDAAGVTRAALVQPVGVYRYDNAYLLDATAGHPDRFIAVPALDPFAPNAPTRLQEMADTPGVRGLRLFVPGGGPDGWPDLPDLYPLLEASAQCSLVVSLQAQPPQLGDIGRLAARFPSTPIMVEQLAGMTMRDGRLPNLLALAALENLYLKVVNQNLGDDPGGQLLRQLLVTFGADRVCWGSNFPATSGSEAGYATIVSQALDALSLTENEKTAVLGGTAARLYGVL